MLSLSIGPLALPAGPVVLLLAFGAALLLATRLAAPDVRPTVDTTLWLAFAAGLLAARVVHLLRHADLYAPLPWTMLDVRDGGWHAASGWLAGVAVVIVRAAARPASRRPIGIGALAGAAAWAGADTWLMHEAGGPEAPLPAVELVSLDAAVRRPLPDLADGRPMVVNLWASWCGPCRAEMPVLVEAQRRHPQVRFVFVNQGESPDIAREYLRRADLQPSDVWLDPASRLGPAVGSRGLPTTLFVDARGARIDAHMGVLNAAALLVALRRLGPPAR